MDQNEIPENANFRDYVALAVVTGAVALSVYHIGRLGRDWTKEIIEIRKEKKMQKEY